eukprot:15343722-Ditylum_brightwellii.AAC.1
MEPMCRLLQMQRQCVYSVLIERLLDNLANCLQRRGDDYRFLEMLHLLERDGGGGGGGEGEGIAFFFQVASWEG